MIPLAGFYEAPKALGKKTRPRIDRPDGEPVRVTGLWNRVETPDGPPEACMVMIRPPAADLEHVHDRMPALLMIQEPDPWLDAFPSSAEALTG